MLSSSMSTSLILMSPAMTIPLSRTRSRMSARLLVSLECIIFCRDCMAESPLPGRCRSIRLRPRERRFVEQAAQWAEVDVEIVDLEMFLQHAHLLLETHQGGAELLDLHAVEASPLDPAQGLFLHQLAQQLDDREDQLDEPLLDPRRIEVDPLRELGLGDRQAPATGQPR